MFLHYLGKLKNEKNYTFRARKHVSNVTHISNVTFYHLSNIYLSNVVKMRANISTAQNINI